MRFNLANTTSQDYDKLFDLVDKGFDVPVLVYSKNIGIHDIAMARRNKNFDIHFQSRGIIYNDMFIDNCHKDSQKDVRKKAFIEMCKHSDVYFFDNIK